jgi:sugar/nucleoside kinase (ribokinase family)
MTGEADLYQALGGLSDACPYVVVKRGADGATALVDGELFEGRTVAVEALDSTGAGDCFTAGFLYGYLRGFPPATCLGFGNVCGGRSVTAVGGYQGAPTEAELLAESRLRGLLPSPP